MISKPGVLHIVATPIGNLKDITLRAREVLAEADVIAAEDTRHSAKLLSALGISRPLLSLHEHNEVSQAKQIINRLKKGTNVALISDAGTPLISDPGFKLVDLAYKNAIPVVPIPGPSSITTALSAAGISSASFIFIGFLPARAAQRRQALKAMRNHSHTLVMFESPHRIVPCLNDMVEFFGENRQACLCRELTKQFETITRGTLIELKEFVESDKNQQRGEFVLVVSPSVAHSVQQSLSDYTALLEGMLEYMPAKNAAVLLAKHSGLGRNVFYQMALEIKSQAK